MLNSEGLVNSVYRSCGITQAGCILKWTLKRKKAEQVYSWIWIRSLLLLPYYYNDGTNYGLADCLYILRGSRCDVVAAGCENPQFPLRVRYAACSLLLNSDKY